MAILEVVAPIARQQLPPPSKSAALWAQLTENVRQPPISPIVHTPAAPTPRGEFQVETPFGDATSAKFAP
jgi:hypothetical protein